MDTFSKFTLAACLIIGFIMVLIYINFNLKAYKRKPQQEQPMEDPVLVLTKEIMNLREQNKQLLNKVRIANKYKSLCFSMYDLVKFVTNSHNERLSAQAKSLQKEFYALQNERKGQYKKEVKDA